LKLVFVGPNAAHFRACVAGNHRICELRFVICDFRPNFDENRSGHPTTTGAVSINNALSQALPAGPPPTAGLSFPHMQRLYLE